MIVFHDMPTVGKKPHGRKTNMKINEGMMDIFRPEHIKNDVITE